MKRITIDDNVKFAINYLYLHQDGNTIYSCSLSGEFLNGGEPFDPPIVYSMSNVGVTTDDLYQILTPIYYDLLAEREKK